MKAINDFYSKRALCHSRKTYFISLIPKKKDATKLKDFRPISLINSFYKLLSKTIACQMEEVMSDVISPFLKGWQMFNYSLVANECIDH